MPRAPQASVSSPLALAIVSGALSFLSAWLLASSDDADAARRHEVRRATASAEGVAQRFLEACASGQHGVAAALSPLAGARAQQLCPELPPSLTLQTVFVDSEVVAHGRLRLRGHLEVGGTRRPFDAEVERSEQGWHVATATVEGPEANDAPDGEADW